jgi:hypothetical protein
MRRVGREAKPCLDRYPVANKCGNTARNTVVSMKDRLDGKSDAISDIVYTTQ